MRPDRGSKRLRKGRRSVPNQSYLITTNTHKREKIFHDAAASEIVLKSLQWLDNQGRMILDAVVVMPDHVHFVVELKTSNLRKLMHSFKSYTANEINTSLKRQSAVWQRGYHDHAVRKEEDLNEVILYALNNPVRAGLVDDFHDHPYWYCRWEV